MWGFIYSRYLAKRAYGVIAQFSPLCQVGAEFLADNGDGPANSLQILYLAPLPNPILKLPVFKGKIWWRYSEYKFLRAE